MPVPARGYYTEHNHPKKLYAKALRPDALELHTRLYSQTGNNYGFSASESDPLLFNIEQDPGERFDVSDQHPSEITPLQTLLQEFRDGLSAEGTFWD